jgi:hypothetical protein
MSGIAETLPLDSRSPLLEMEQKVDVPNWPLTVLKSPMIAEESRQIVPRPIKEG